MKSNITPVLTITTQHKSKSKVDAFTKAFKHIFQHIQEHHTDVIENMRLQGVYIKTDNYFIGKWKKAIELYDQMGEEVKKALKNNNIGELKEWQSIASMESLIEHYFEYKCVFGKEEKNITVVSD
jgi:hypothetical protein